MLLFQLGHIEFLCAWLLLEEAVLNCLLFSLLILLNLLHHFYSLFLLLTALLGLLSELERQVLPRYVSLRLFLLFLISLLLHRLFGLGPESLCLVDLGAAGELVPHFAGALHEILILHLLEPPLAQSALVIRVDGALLYLIIVDFQLFLLLEHLFNCGHLNSVFAELGRHLNRFAVCSINGLLRVLPIHL